MEQHRTKQTHMTTLQYTYRKNTYSYIQVMRNEHAAIYAQMDGDRLVAYEVGYVKVRKDGEINGTPIEGGECFWSNEDFGRIAWSMLTKNAAMQRYWRITRDALAKPVKMEA